MLLLRNMEDQIMLQLIVKGYVRHVYTCREGEGGGGRGRGVNSHIRRMGVLVVPFRS